VKIVLDTNVLVSGLLNPYGPPGQIVQMVATGEICLCFDARIFAEYRDVLLRPKFDFRAAHVDAILEQIRAAGASVASHPLTGRLPDRDDEPFFEVAIASAADYLVTGNLRHYPARLRSGVALVSPAQFVEAYRHHKPRI
jgi:uncharacterized protein